MHLALYYTVLAVAACFHSTASLFGCRVSPLLYRLTLSALYLYTVCIVFTICLSYYMHSHLLYRLSLSTLSQSLLLQYFPLLFVTQFVYFSSISLLLYLASFFLYPPSSLVHSYICPSFTVSLPLYLLFIFSSFFPPKISFLLETVSFFFLIFFFSESSFLFLSILFSFVLR